MSANDKHLELLAAIYDALDVPSPARQADAPRYLELIARRTAHVRGAISAVLNGAAGPDPATAAIRDHDLPVTYRPWEK